MKNYLFLITLSLMLVSCGNDYRAYCEKDEMYHKHSWKLMSIYTSTECGFDEWYNEECTKCGLQRKFNADITLKAPIDGEDGAVYLFKSPTTGQYDDLCVGWLDDFGKGAQHYKSIDADNLKKNPNI